MKEIAKGEGFTQQDAIKEIAEAEAARLPPEGAFKVQDYLDYISEHHPSLVAPESTVRRRLDKKVEQGELNKGMFLDGYREKVFYWPLAGVEKG